MKKLSIILACFLVTMISCTKNKEFHPEIGDGNNELLTVGINNISVKYIRNDIANLQKVVFHYSITDARQFDAAEMTKTSDCFMLTLNNLQSDTLYSYYYELFPYSGNTSNTDQKTFRTQSTDTPAPPTPPTPPSDVPEGAINGLFTINENGDKVYFSQGNLQYIGSVAVPYWKFADNQWEYIGDYGQGSDSQYVDRDLFGWATSGYAHGSICYQPWSISINNNDYYAYNTDYYNLYDQTGMADWGYNSIINGGNQINMWRTLNHLEWFYLVDLRETQSGVRFAKANVNNVNGLLLFPDNWDETCFVLSNANQIESDFNANIIYDTEWTELEIKGVVFLPATGQRVYGTSFEFIGTNGSYWLSDCNANLSGVRCIAFNKSSMIIGETSRHYGFSVRLVQDAN